MMASSGTQQQRLWLRQPSGSRSFVLAAPTLLFVVLVLLFLAVFAQPSSCRPPPLGVDDHRPNNNNNGVVDNDKAAATATDVILLPLRPSVPRAEDEDRRHRLAGGRHQWLLNKKPRGKAPPSAPSKRTN